MDFKRRLVGAEHIEAGHEDVEQDIARLLAFGALGGPLQHLVVDRAQQPGNDVVLGVELPPQGRRGADWPLPQCPAG